MKTQPVILTIDEGTSGTRAALVSQDGRVHCLEYASLRVNTPIPRVVEQDADELLNKTIMVCQQCLRHAKDHHFHVIAFALSTQRSTAVLWDARTGKALVPAMVWQDARFTTQLQQMAQIWDQRLLEATGRPATNRSPFLWASWHLQHTPVVQQAFTAGQLRFGTIDSWLLWHLSEAHTVVTTPTNATSAGAYCPGEHCYYYPWLDALEFPAVLLPQLMDDADDFGYSRKDKIGIRVPIYACLGDQYAGAIGLGCIAPGQSMCIHGTGSFVDLMTGTAIPSLNSDYETTLSMVARRQDHQSWFAVETFVPTTGSALNWLCETLNWFDDAQQISALAANARSSGGVTFIPALTGLRVPCLAPDVRAALNGITFSTTRNELAYAIIEGIAHAACACLRANEQTTGSKVEKLIVGGGMSASDLLVQIQANLSGIPVVRVRETARASLRGAAFLAGCNGLLWDSLDEACATVAITHCFTPQFDTAQRECAIHRWENRVNSELQFGQTPDIENDKL